MPTYCSRDRSRSKHACTRGWGLPIKVLLDFSGPCGKKKTGQREGTRAKGDGRRKIDVQVNLGGDDGDEWESVSQSSRFDN
jgi:hypothetical protein